VKVGSFENRVKEEPVGKIGGRDAPRGGQ